MSPSVLCIHSLLKNRTWSAGMQTQDLQTKKGTERYICLSKNDFILYVFKKNRKALHSKQCIYQTQNTQLTQKKIKYYAIMEIWWLCLLMRQWLNLSYYKMNSEMKSNVAYQFKQGRNSRSQFSFFLSIQSFYPCFVKISGWHLPLKSRELFILLLSFCFRLQPPWCQYILLRVKPGICSDWITKYLCCLFLKFSEADTKKLSWISTILLNKWTDSQVNVKIN